MSGSWRGAAAAALWALAVWVLLWHSWLAPPGAAPPALIAALAVSPLVPVLLLWIRRPRLGLLWGTIVGLGYFAHGVTVAMTDAKLRWLGAVEVALVLVLLGALGAATRAERRQRRAGAEAR